MKLRFLFATLAVALATAGCGDDAPAPAAHAPAAKKATAAATSAKGSSETALIVPTIVYAYNPIGKRDPFRSPLGDETRAGAVAQTSCTEPLCQWDLDQLTLVAVVTGDSSPVAMVQDPKGTGYVVRRNARIGKQGGKVSAILRDAISVTEFWTGPDGKTTPNVINVGLKKDAASMGDTDLATGKVYQ